MKPIMTLPCKNKHTEMEQIGAGFHCKNCNHVLTDFRNSTNDEIQTTLRNSAGKICGVFNSNQFDYKISQVQLPAFRAVGLSLLGILGFLGPVVTSCETAPNATEHKQNAFNLLKFPMHIKGTVEDEKTGEPLPFFEVELLQHDKVIKTVKTDKDGVFDFLIKEKDLDQEVFQLVIGGNGFENDTITSNITKFKNKKVKLSIQASAQTTIRALGKADAVKIDKSCATVEGEVMPPEPILGGIPAIEVIETQKPIDTPESLIVGTIENEAEFYGGQEALRQYLVRNVNYPKEALNKGIGGRVYLKFQIDEYGSISKVKVQRGIADCPECDDEAVRVIRMMPRWKPAQSNGKSISSWYNLPITFKP